MDKNKIIKKTFNERMILKYGINEPSKTNNFPFDLKEKTKKNSRLNNIETILLAIDERLKRIEEELGFIQ